MRTPWPQSPLAYNAGPDTNVPVPTRFGSGTLRPISSDEEFA